MNYLQQAFQRVRAKLDGTSPHEDVYHSVMSDDDIRAMRERDAKRRAQKIAEMGPAYVGYPQVSRRAAEQRDLPTFLRNQGA